MKIINFFKIGLVSSLLLAGTSALAQKAFTVESFAKAPMALPINTLATKFKTRIKELTGLKNDSDIGRITINSAKRVTTGALHATAPSTSKNGTYMNLRTSTQITVGEANSSASPQYYAVSYTIIRIPLANFNKIINAVNEAMEDSIIYAVCNTITCPS
ncbi:MAG: hypothetical protein KAS93_03070 [Gammaproteobacteria bacterium]|nr:hypothetical protein [Gammaproteobacteria bacterium]